MNKRHLNEIAVALEKVNYLYRNIRKSNEPIKRLEQALLKKYVLDLYDSILLLEMPATESEATPTDTPKSKFEYQAVLTPPALPTVEQSMEEKPIVNEILAEEVTPIAKIVELPKIEEVVEVTMPASAQETAEEEVAEDDAARTQVLDDLVRRDSAASFNGNVQQNTVTNEFIGDDSDEGETIALGDISQAIKPSVDSGVVVKKDTGSQKSATGSTNKYPVTLNQKVAFVANLFKGNEAAYNDSMVELSEAKGYIEALTYINLNLRYDFDWKDNDPTVKEFLDIIKHHYLG